MASASPLASQNLDGLAPSVSIGLPVYNGARFLPQAIESLLGQTYLDTEIIISDNASDDGTAEISREFAARDRRVRYIRRKEHTGAPDNWNFVALHARGTYFKWASANDYCSPELVEKCVAVLEADPRVVVCHGRTCLVDEETGVKTEYKDDISATQIQPSERFKTVSRRLALNNALSGVIRTDVLRTTRLTRHYQGGDQALMAELAFHGHIFLLPEVLFFRRMGHSSFSSSLTERELERFLDPDRLHRMGFKRLKRHLDHVRTLVSAPVGISEKARSLALVAQNAIWERGALWSELVDGLRHRRN